MYVALEGIDGVGKSTQLAHLQAAFPQALFTKEPGATPLGSAIRSLVLGDGEYSKKAELLLFLADRAEHTATRISPALAAGRLVISDRSLISGIAYADRSLEMAELCELNRFATDGLFPDKVIVLTITSSGYEKRIHIRNEGKDRIESRGTAYMMQTQERLIQACRALNIPCFTIEAEQDEMTIFKAIKELIHD